MSLDVVWYIPCTSLNFRDVCLFRVENNPNIQYLYQVLIAHESCNRMQDSCYSEVWKFSGWFFAAFESLRFFQYSRSKVVIENHANAYFSRFWTFKLQVDSHFWKGPAIITPPQCYSRLYYREKKWVASFQICSISDNLFFRAGENKIVNLGTKTMNRLVTERGRLLPLRNTLLMSTLISQYFLTE